MSRNISYACLDIGEKRIGVALADGGVKISVPFQTIAVDGAEITAISQLILSEAVDILVIGYPRNQSGEPTAQTQFVVDFVERLRNLNVTIVYQDESLTSVMAEQRLKSYKKPYAKGDIDAQAAAIILQDYLEQYS